MSKPKSRKIKIRKRWKINPQTKIEASAKRYLRARERRKTHQDIQNASKKGT